MASKSKHTWAKATVEQDALGLYIPISGGSVPDGKHPDRVTYHFRCCIRPYSGRTSKYRIGEEVTIRGASEAFRQGFVIDELELWCSCGRDNLAAPTIEDSAYATVLKQALTPDAAASAEPIIVLQGHKYFRLTKDPGGIGGVYGNDGVKERKSPGKGNVKGIGAVVRKDALGLFIPIVGELANETVEYDDHRRNYLRPYKNHPTLIQEGDDVQISYTAKDNGEVLVQADVADELWFELDDKTTKPSESKGAYDKRLVAALNHTWDFHTIYDSWCVPAIPPGYTDLEDGVHVRHIREQEALASHLCFRIREMIAEDHYRDPEDAEDDDEEDIQVPIDHRGHQVLFDKICMLMMREATPLADLRRLFEAIKSKSKLDKPIRLGDGTFSRTATCGYCGEEVIWLCDGLSVFPETECAHKDGLVFSFELNVPSGVMMVGNDFREKFSITGDFDVNKAVGCVKTSLAMAEIGCAYAFVGNSCPGVYRQEDGSLIIGSPGIIEGTKENGYKDKVVKDPRFAKRVASICTDLWWYSIVDGDEFKRRGLKKGTSGATPVKVKSGVYRFTHYRHGKDFDDGCGNGKPVIYSKAEWVRKPDPVRDFDAERKAMNFTAGQVIANSIRRWPTLYNGHYAVRRVAEHIMCVGGGGGDWHENGFIQYDPEMKPSDPEVAIPDFSDPAYRAVPNIYDHMPDENVEEHWYTMSDYCSLVQAGRGKIHLNPSFVALARNVARAIMTCPKPTKPDTSRDMKHTVQEWQSNIDSATKALAGLDKLYDGKGQRKK